MYSGLFNALFHRLPSHIRVLLTILTPPPPPPRIYVLILLCCFAPPLQAQGSPSPPTNRRVGRITHNSITFHWDKSPGATSYELARESDFTWRNVGNVSSYTWTGLSPEKTDTYYIRARNDNGVSSGNTFRTLTGTKTLAAPPKSPKSTPKPTATPIWDTINHLPPDIQVNNWDWDAQGQQIDHVGVGRADVIPHHEIIDAVNIWGIVTPGIEVCFDQPGRLLFVDSVYPPIDPVSLPAYQRDGMTCGAIDRAGSVVLLEGEQTAEEQTEDQQTQSQALSGCEVRPIANLKFRHSPPDGSVRSVTGVRDWLPASEKRQGYFKVRLWDVDGWISGDYVATHGNCGA